MTAADDVRDAAARGTGPQERLDFLFDASGWRSRGESRWHSCGEGAIGGREMLAVALCGHPASPLPATVLADVALFARQGKGLPLALILCPARVSDEPQLRGALSDLLAGLSAYRQQAPVAAAVLAPLVGPIAMAARLADIVCLGPQGSLSLADEATRRQVLPVNGTTPFLGGLDCAFASDAAALLGLRRILGLLPAGEDWTWRGHASDSGEDPALERLVGTDPDAAIDGGRLLQLLSDDRTFVELGHRNGLIAGLAMIGGETVGVLASNADAMSGVVDAAALAKAGRLVRFCGRHDLPVVTLVDSPGVLPDDAALAALADLISAWADCGVPAVSLIARRAIGAAIAALVPPPGAGRVVLHWPGARVGLRRTAACTPDGRMVVVRETRRALTGALRSIRRART